MADLPQRTDKELILRAFTFFRDASYAASFMAKRVSKDDPLDNEHPWRVWYDWQTLITHLWRMRQAALLMGKAQSAEPLVNKAVAKFDKTIPDLRTYRNLIEHVESYVFEDADRHNKSIDSSGLQVGSFSNETFSWPIRNDIKELNLKDILLASSDLFQSLKIIKDNYVTPSIVNKK
jgi:hypothetical protein